ncbi:hypothetical protein GQ600_3653 [Phytophthora cactorum]|nr:hypothetical protein GQ600_3653 [Phytophthora cactorum]
MNPAPASSAPSEAPPALPAATEVSAEPPAAPPVPGDASAPVTEASLQAMLSEISEASVEQMMTSMLPYLTAIVPASRLTSSSHRCGRSASFEQCCGFDDVLAAVQPFQIRYQIFLAKLVAERDAVIQVLERRLAKEREALRLLLLPTPSKTRQLHAMLIKAQKGKFVDADTAHSLEDLQKRTLIFSTSTVSSVVT